MFDLKPVKYRHFFYSICAMEAVPALLDVAVGLGAELISIIPTTAQVSGGIVHKSGQPQVIQAAFILMRCAEKDFETVQKAAKLEADKAHKAGIN